MHQCNDDAGSEKVGDNKVWGLEVRLAESVKVVANEKDCCTKYYSCSRFIVSRTKTLIETQRAKEDRCVEQH